MWRLLGSGVGSPVECGSGGGGLRGLMLGLLDDLCGGLVVVMSSAGHSWQSLCRPVLEKLPSPGPMHWFVGSMLGGIWGIAVWEWDFGGQLGIVAADLGDKVEVVWGEMCATVASDWGDAEDVC